MEQGEEMDQGEEIEQEKGEETNCFYYCHKGTINRCLKFMIAYVVIVLYRGPGIITDTETSTIYVNKCSLCRILNFVCWNFNVAVELQSPLI